MSDPEEAYTNLTRLLDINKVEYKLFTHKATFTYEDLAEVQRETGFTGTEGKCLVLKAGDKFVVYVTLQGNRANFDVIKQILVIDKIRLASPDELKEYFGAKPGCAYPFGFSKDVDIYVDLKIYETDWFLFSPVLPTKTIQAKGRDLENVFSYLENRVTEVNNFNQI
ncbi:MAG: YbaK/EbsC family protein [Patescibacteria group bacterium]|nr:YbaK/EbsC family protein [Patescibacteria group bacterium]